MKTNEVQSSTSLQGWGRSGCPTKPFTQLQQVLISPSCTPQAALSLSWTSLTATAPAWGHRASSTCPSAKKHLLSMWVASVLILCIIHRGSTLHVLPQQLLCLQLQKSWRMKPHHTHTLLLHTAAWGSSCFISRYWQKYPWWRAQLPQFLPSLMLLFHLESLEKFGFSFLVVWYFKLFKQSRDKDVTHFVHHP